MANGPDKTVSNEVKVKEKPPDIKGRKTRSNSASSGLMLNIKGLGFQDGDQPDITQVLNAMVAAMEGNLQKVSLRFNGLEENLKKCPPKVYLPKEYFDGQNKLADEIKAMTIKINEAGKVSTQLAEFCENMEKKNKALEERVLAIQVGELKNTEGFVSAIDSLIKSKIEDMRNEDAKTRAKENEDLEVRVANLIKSIPPTTSSGDQPEVKKRKIAKRRSDPFVAAHVQFIGG